MKRTSQKRFVAHRGFTLHYTMFSQAKLVHPSGLSGGFLECCKIHGDINAFKKSNGCSLRAYYVAGIVSGAFQY